MSDYISRESALTELCNRSKATFSIAGKPILDVNYVEAIKAIPAADVVSGRDFRDCRNELCLRCGEYKHAHEGACNGCRWKH